VTDFNGRKLRSNPELNASAQAASCVHVNSSAV
jgi:hypothetical protein